MKMLARLVTSSSENTGSLRELFSSLLMYQDNLFSDSDRTLSIWKLKIYSHANILLYVKYNSFQLNHIQYSTRMMFIKHYAPNKCLCIKVAKSTMCN